MAKPNKSPHNERFLSLSVNLLFEYVQIKDFSHSHFAIPCFVKLPGKGRGAYLNESQEVFSRLLWSRPGTPWIKFSCHHIVELVAATALARSVAAATAGIVSVLWSSSFGGR